MIRPTDLFFVCLFVVLVYFICCCLFVCLSYFIFVVVVAAAVFQFNPETVKEKKLISVHFP